MIFDHIASASVRPIEARFPALREALDWIRRMPPAPADGITELHGAEMYVNVHGYPTLEAGRCRWESHRQTIDLQYCIAGGEEIDWLPFGSLRPMEDYQGGKDAEHWHGSDLRPTRLLMMPGTFAVFFANELHRPKISDGVHPEVRKLVVKIRASLLEEVR